MAARVLTDDDLEPLRREIAELRAQLAGRATGDHLTTEQAAAVAGRSPKTIRAWVASGALRAGRRGRHLVISRRDLDAFLAGAADGVGVDDVLDSLGRR